MDVHITEPAARESRGLLACLSGLWQVWRLLLVQGISMLAGTVALTVPDQAQDLLNTLSAPISQPGYLIAFTAGVAVWLLSIWYTGRVMLCLSGITVRAESVRCAQWAFKWLPRLTGAAPAFVFGAVFVARAFKNLPGEQPLIAAGLFYMLGGAMLAFTTFRGKLISGIDRDAEGMKARQMMGDTVVLQARTLDQYEGRRSVYALLVLTAFTLVLSLFPFFIRFVSNLGPATIIIVALALYTGIWALVFYMQARSGLPVFWAALLWFGLCSQFNDNHSIRLANPQSAAVARPDPAQHLRGWARGHGLDTAGGDVPVFIVAAEGGGIRALCWTAGLMDLLEKNIPGFYNRVYATDGASGGMVGLVMHHCYQVAMREYGVGYDSAKFDNLIAGDYLSRVTGAFAFGDYAQQFLPFPVPYLDRARWLEDAWSDGFATCTGKDLRLMDSAFLSLWSAHPYAYPALLVNGTVMESGQKAVYSNLDMTAGQKWFPNLMDIHALTGRRDVPVKTAALLAARFPYLTPGGVLQDTAGTKFATIIDGGYFDNYGIQTATQLAAMITDLRDTDTTYRHLVPVIIFIRNGWPQVVHDPGYYQSLYAQFMHEVATPPKGMMSSRDALPESFMTEARQRFMVLEFRLNRSTGVELPLGWYLSDRAHTEIRSQIDAVARPGLRPGDTVAGQNHKTLQTLMGLLNPARPVTQ